MKLFLSSTEEDSAPSDGMNAFSEGEMNIFRNRSVVSIFTKFTFISNSYEIQHCLSLVT